LVIIFFVMTRAMASAILEAYASRLVEVCEGSWQLYLDEKIPRENPTTRANIVNDHMHAQMRRVLAEATATAAPRGDKPMYQLDALTVRLKLLKSDRSANVNTVVQSKIARQLPLDATDLDQPHQLVLTGMETEPPPPPPAPPYITIGPQLDKAGTEVADVRATMRFGRKKLWSLSLRDLAAFGTSPADITPIRPVAPDAPGLPGVAARLVPAAVDESPSPAAPLRPPAAIKTPDRKRKASADE
jgi:hypothetical protein